MQKRLVKVGNSLGLVIDKSLLSVELPTGVETRLD
jgi:hypothetical protein